MIRSAFVPACADPGRPMPATAAARLDTIRAAVASLRDERRRLERLGLELPLARCHRQLRYWEFLEGLFALEGTTASHEFGASS
jgi:hypothetical protein